MFDNPTKSMVSVPFQCLHIIDQIGSTLTVVAKFSLMFHNSELDLTGFGGVRGSLNKLGETLSR